MESETKNDFGKKNHKGSINSFLDFFDFYNLPSKVDIIDNKARKSQICGYFLALKLIFKVIGRQRRFLRKNTPSGTNNFLCERG